jgi:DNA-binding CsgD family transcriptional regulator
MSELNSVFDFQDVGICITTPGKKVLFQNNACKLICGDNSNQVCDLCKHIVCKEDNLNLLPLIDQSKSVSAQKQSLADTLVDINRFIESDQKIMTILTPADKIIQKYENHFKKIKFTPREIEIGILILKQKSNIMIQETLFISKSTLKTHLNHIYQKCPKLKNARQESSAK